VTGGCLNENEKETENQKGENVMIANEEGDNING